MNTAPIVLDLFNPVTIPPPAAPCEWCRSAPGAQLVAITPPKVVTRGENRGDVKAHGTAVRVCAECGNRLDLELEAKAKREADERERKLAERRKTQRRTKAGDAMNLTELPPAPPADASDRDLLEWWKAAAAKYRADADQLADALELTLRRCAELRAIVEERR